MISRRDLLRISGFVGLAPRLTAFGQEAPQPDYELDIATTTLELAPRQAVKTIAYNGRVPGPLLRFKEGRPVTIDVNNRTDRPEVVHWHVCSSLPRSMEPWRKEHRPLLRTRARATHLPRAPQAFGGITPTPWR